MTSTTIAPEELKSARARALGVLTAREVRVLSAWLCDELPVRSIARTERVTQMDVIRIVEWARIKLTFAGFAPAQPSASPATLKYVDPEELDRLAWRNDGAANC